MHAEYNFLINLVRHYFSPHSENRQNEHLFSVAGLIYGPTRNPLFGDKLFFIRYLSLLSFDY